MRYSISGSDKDTGEPIEMTVEAADMEAAHVLAARKGIIRTRVVEAAIVQHAATTLPSYVPPLEQGHVHGAPVINIAPPRRGNSLGVASLVLGILGFLICWIPLVNLLGVPLTGLGLVLGFIGLLVAFTRRGSSVGFPIAGIAVCGLSLFVAITMTKAIGDFFKATNERFVADNNRRNATNQTEVVPTPKQESGFGARTGSALTGSTQAYSSVVASAVPTPKPPDPSVSLGQWAPADNPVRQGDVQVRITSAKVGKVTTVHDDGRGDGETTHVLLAISLAITNLSETKKLDYGGWGGRPLMEADGTRITDNFDNKYVHITIGYSFMPKGAVRSESIYPGKTITDVLVFEEPVAKAEYLNLELPASKIGGWGTLRFRIPGSMIQHLSKTDENAADAPDTTQAPVKNPNPKLERQNDAAPGTLTAGEAARVVTPWIELETSMGNIVIEVDEAKAPISAANFLTYVGEGFYDGTIFHRVINDFMIQGGGFTFDMVEKKATHSAIKNEWNNGLKNVRGSVAMARTRAADSAASQFFINVKDNAYLDQPFDGAGYAVFGKVISGMGVVDEIKAVKTGINNNMRDVPDTTVTIKKAHRLTADEAARIRKDY